MRIWKFDNAKKILKLAYFQMTRLTYFQIKKRTNSKLISVLVNGIISFAILVLLSFFMNKFINNSQQTFTQFFQEKWMIFAGFALIFVLYKNFIQKKRN